MDIEKKEQLAHRGDMGKKASAIRVKAARYFSGVSSQREFAKKIGVGVTAYNNIEKGRQYPNHAVLKYLYRVHGVDFNFTMNGDFSHYSASDQDRLFAALERANNEWDRTADSD